MSDIPISLTRKVLFEKTCHKVYVFKENGDTDEIKIKITEEDKHKIILCRWQGSMYRVWCNKWGTTTTYGEINDDDGLFFYWDD